MSVVEVRELVEDRVLCVDLDGTLLRSDLLVETAFELLKRNILYLFLMPLWLMRGKARLKQEIAVRVEIDPSTLPYHAGFLDYLRAERRNGRRLALTTASHTKLAHVVAAYLGLFDEVHASDGQTNLSGERKLVRLTEHYGAGNFDYAGNAKADLRIWAGAHDAIIVNPGPGVEKAARDAANVIARFDDRPGTLKCTVRALRLHQWLKNVLVFTPLVLAHEIADIALVAQACLAFVAFGLCASSVYLLNDLFDLTADRRHPTKRHRPLAAGDLPITRALVLIPGLLAAAAGIALLLPWAFAAVLGIYYAITLAYSLYLKRAVLVDVLVLAGLFTLRVIAGGAAVAIPVSFWLLAFSMFIFLSLALVKRYVELNTLARRSRTTAEGRGYRDTDLETLAHFGVASGYMAVLVLALYVHSSDVTLLYGRPEVIWFLCPLVLYLVSRIWLLARRDEMHDDPIVFAIKDARSQFTVALAAVLMWIAAS